jgi:hypothetical protein
MKRRKDMKKFIPLVLLLSAALASCGTPAILADTENDYYVTGNFAGWGGATEVLEEDGVTKKYMMEAVSVSDERVASIKSQLKSPEFLYVKEVVLPSAAAGWNKTYTTTSDGQPRDFDGNLTLKVIQTAKDDFVPQYWAQSPESGVVNNLTPDTVYVPPFLEEAPWVGSGAWNDDPVAYVAGTYIVVLGSQVFVADGFAELFLAVIAA